MPGSLFEWLGSVLASTAAAGGLLALAAWKWKALISQWLAKDLQAQRLKHEAELQDKSQQHERELEAYRTSLIAAAEAAKANQELKKAAALLVVQKEFAALHKLHLATLGNAGLFLSHWKTIERPFPLEIVKMLHDRSEELGNALDQASFFIEAEDRMLIINYRQLLLDITGLCVNNHPVPTDHEHDTRRQGLLMAELAVDNLLKKELARIRSMQ